MNIYSIKTKKYIEAHNLYCYNIPIYFYNLLKYKSIYRKKLNTQIYN